MAIHIRQNASASVSSMQRMMKKAYKSELDPNNKQVTSMRRHVRAVRWAYNWGIGRIGRWFVSVLAEEDARLPQPPEMGDVSGVDVGIKTLATCSDGECYINPKALAAKTRFSADGLKQSNSLAEATAPGFSSGPRRRRGHPRNRVSVRNSVSERPALCSHPGVE
jgi:transposase